jgi:autotransporter translocation and assembly factor TamB
VSREFVVTQGTVHYFGTPDLDAELDIEARHVVHPLPSGTSGAGGGGAAAVGAGGDITVIAHIRGTLLVPRLTLEAERSELSQSELISYLMFGRPRFALAGGPGALARGVAAGLVAGEVERTVVSDLGVPLDYFEFRPGDPSDPLARTQVAAGWQIGNKTFLVLNAGFCRRQQVLVTNTLGASLQFRISPEWRTEASFEPVPNCLATGADPQSARQVGLDLFWERRY